MSPIPVSYTHLDVYKRQLHGPVRGAADNPFHLGGGGNKLCPCLFVQTHVGFQLSLIHIFLGIDLSRVPHFAFDAASLMLMIIPILSVVLMILSQIITMKMSGQEKMCIRDRF